MKDKINNLKEAWQDRRKRAGIKLLAYIIFFIFLLASAGITSRVNSRSENLSTTTTKTTKIIIDKYSDKQLDLLTDKYNITYVIKDETNEYKINGMLDNNLVNGYLETKEGIKKIVIKNNNLYEINNDEETELNIINNNFISINYIINLIKQNSAIISDNNNIKSYVYNIDENIKVTVSTNETIIKEIKIEDNTSSYLLNFDK